MDKTERVEMKAFIEFFNKQHVVVKRETVTLDHVPQRGDGLFLHKGAYYVIVGVSYNKTFDKVFIEANELLEPIQGYCEHVVDVLYEKKKKKK
jgi:hypothetical protein